MDKDNHIVYGMFVDDPEHKLDMIPTDHTNKDGSWKCIYVGKSMQGLDKRIGQHDSESKREFYKDGRRYASYDYLKNQMLRKIAELGLEHKDEVLCPLTDGEEFEQYVKYMRAGHPCSNMKNCDQYTTIKDELEELYKAGEITTKEDLAAAVTRLTHERKLRDDEAYANRDEKRRAKHEKLLIRSYLIRHLPDEFTHEDVLLGRYVVFLHAGKNDVKPKIDNELASDYVERMRVGANILYPEERLDMVISGVQYWTNSAFVGHRLRTKTLKELIIEQVVDWFETAEEFAVSIGYLASVDINKNGLYSGGGK